MLCVFMHMYMHGKTSTLLYTCVAMCTYIIIICMWVQVCYYVNISIFDFHDRECVLPCVYIYGKTIASVYTYSYKWVCVARYVCMGVVMCMYAWQHEAVTMNKCLLPCTCIHLHGRVVPILVSWLVHIGEIHIPLFIK